MYIYIYTHTHTHTHTYIYCTHTRTHTRYIYIYNTHTHKFAAHRSSNFITDRGCPRNCVRVRVRVCAVADKFICTYAVVELK